MDAIEPTVAAELLTEERPIPELEAVDADGEPQEIPEDPVVPKLKETSWSDETPLVSITVLLKEASLDSPTFRSSVNHLNAQLERVERWLDSFLKATQKLSQEMDGRWWLLNIGI